MRTPQTQQQDTSPSNGATIVRAARNQKAVEAKHQAGGPTRVRVTHGRVVGAGYDHDAGAALPGDVITVSAGEAKRLVAQGVAAAVDE